MSKFEKYLQEIHAKQYHGLDDDMPDAYQDWLCNLDIEEIIAYADNYAEYRIKNLKEAK